MRKKRGYSRESSSSNELARDYRLFAIACEGAEREPQYFNVFQYASKRIKVDVIQDVMGENMDEVKPNNSSPRWVLDRVMRYIEKEGLSDEDLLYFVIDTDRWSHEQINSLAEYCAQRSNWNLVISNPCFEVWLYFHKRTDISNSEANSCKEFKSEIATFEKGGYHPYKFLPYLLDAIENAKRADIQPEYYFPAHKQTKVYQLAEELIKIIGINDYNDFLEKILPQLIQNSVKK